MKKYILHIILFFAIIVAFDFFYGKAFDFFASHAKGGDSKETYDMLMEGEYDIIILGSSRAKHHYVSHMIEKSLGVSCYNAGVEGNGIILMYGCYKLITNRYNPKMIIYDVEPTYDIKENPEDDHNRRYLANLRLKDFFFQPGIRDIFNDVSWLESIKNYSGLFRYNGAYFNHFRNFVKDMPSSDNGYIPLSGYISEEPKKKEESTWVMDALKLSYMQKIVEDARTRGIEFIFVSSPRYKASPLIVQHVKDLADELGVSLWDYTNDIEFQDRKYFKDPTHMNDEGAMKFTSKIIEVIK